MLGWYKKMFWIVTKPQVEWQLIIKEAWTPTPIPDLELIISEEWTS